MPHRSPRALRSALSATAAIVCLLSLSACGLKGPLYLPETGGSVEPSSPSSPFSAPEAADIEATSPFGDDPVQPPMKKAIEEGPAARPAASAGPYTPADGAAQESEKNTQSGASGLESSTMLSP